MNDDDAGERRREAAGWLLQRAVATVANLLERLERVIDIKNGGPTSTLPPSGD